MLFMYFPDVEDLQNEVRKQLFEELLDCNVQKGLYHVTYVSLILQL